MKDDDDGGHGTEKEAVDCREIDLARGGLRSMHDLQVGKIPEPRGLPSNGISARDDSLRCNERGKGCHRDEHHGHTAGNEEEEGIGDVGGVVDKEGALSEVVENERGKHDGGPGELDRGAPKV